MKSEGLDGKPLGSGSTDSGEYSLRQVWRQGGAGACMQLCGHRLPLRGAGGRGRAQDEWLSASPLPGLDSGVSLLRRHSLAGRSGRRRPGWRSGGQDILQENHGHLPLEQDAPRLTPAEVPGPQTYVLRPPVSLGEFWGEPLSQSSCPIPPGQHLPLSTCTELLKGPLRDLPARPSDWPLAVLSSQLVWDSIYVLLSWEAAEFNLLWPTMLSRGCFPESSVKSIMTTAWPILVST